MYLCRFTMCDFSYILNISSYTVCIPMCVSECLHADCGPHLGLSMNDVQKQASHCNDKKTVSKRVQELSSELFFGVFVKVGNQIINQHVDNKQDTWGTREQYFYCSS